MMTLVNTLQSQGITLSMIQLAILGVVAVYIIGMYWKILVTGAAVLTVAIVLLHSDRNSPLPSANADIVVPQSKVPTVPSESKIPTVPKDFIADCVKGAEFSRAECEKIWSNTDIEPKGEVPKQITESETET
jgi:hypothetical protein